MSRRQKAIHIVSRDFPDLTPDNHVITSSVTKSYNCIAWAAGDNTRKWWPDPDNIGYWPPQITRAENLAAFIQAFAIEGYASCADDELEDGFEKIALYVVPTHEGDEPTHGARQLPDGRWTSKLGDFEDIVHDRPQDLAGPVYGQPVHFMKRAR